MLPYEKLLQVAQTLGLGVQSLDDTIRTALERVRNPSEQHYQPLLILIKDAASHCDDPLLREQIYIELTKHNQQSKRDDNPQGDYANLTRANDSQWQEWALRFEQGLEKLELIKRFAQRFCRVFENSIGDINRMCCEKSDSSDAILACEANIRAILALNDIGLDVPSRRTLESALTKIEDIKCQQEAERLYKNLAAWRSRLAADNFQVNDLKIEANKLLTITPDPTQKSFGLQLLDDLLVFAEWYEEFDKLLCWIEQYQYDGTSIELPWQVVSKETIHQRNSRHKDLIRCCTGLEKWQLEPLNERWRLALVKLEKQGLAAIQEKPMANVGLIMVLNQLIDGWFECLHPYHQVTLWIQQRHSSIDEFAQKATLDLATLRDNYHGYSDSGQSIVNQIDTAYQQQITSFAPKLLNEFTQAENKLRHLDKRYEFYANKEFIFKDGQIEAMSLEFDHDYFELQSMADDWGHSSGFIQLCKRFSDVLSAIEQCKVALGHRAKGELDQAIMQLTAVNFGFVKQILAVIEKDRHSVDLQQQIEQGPLGKISKQSLFEANESVKHDYEKYHQGESFVDDKDKLLTVLKTTTAAEAVLELTKQIILPITNIKLTKFDANRLNAIVETAQETMEQQLDDIILALERQIQCYPLLSLGILNELDAQINQLQLLIRDDVIRKVLLDSLKEALNKLLKIINVHRFCLDMDLSAASQLIDSIKGLSGSQKQSLRITVRYCELGNNKAEVVEWLEFYRENNSILFSIKDRCRDYIDFLRTAEPDQIKPIDVVMLTEHGSDAEQYLTQLCHCCIDPRTVSKNKIFEPHRKDYILLNKLLLSWINTVDYTPYLAELWKQIPTRFHSDVWYFSKSPMELLVEKTLKPFEDIETTLCDPTIDLSQLHLKFQALENNGHIFDDSKIALVGNVVSVEYQLAELKKQDPWDKERQQKLKKLEIEANRINVAIRIARGWDVQLKSRLNGIMLWETFIPKWTQFNQRFSSLDLNFQFNSEQWRPFTQELQNINLQFERLVKGLNWSVENADRSGYWRKLLADFADREEGRLWQQLHSALPGDPQQMATIYRDIQTQVDEFAKLHKKLDQLFEKPSAVNSPALKLSKEHTKALSELHQVRPLCGPVKAIAEQLKTSESSQISNVYQRYTEGLVHHDK